MVPQMPPTPNNDNRFAPCPKIGYVVKRYPRFSETFIVNEILAHEAAGLPVEIHSLRPPSDTHFQNTISQVRAPVRYLTHGSIKAAELWQMFATANQSSASLWATVDWATRNHVSVGEISQSIELALAAIQNGVTHLHAHFATSAATVAHLASRISGIPFSVTMHAKDIFHESVDPETLRHLVESAAAIITVSDFNWRFLCDQFGHAEKIHRVYNGLDLTQFSYDRTERDRDRILAIGRLVPKKGFSDLVHACALLKQQGVSFNCDIVGTGDLEMPLRQLIEQLNVDDCVHLTGPLPQNEVRQRLRTATLLAAPCVIAEDGNRDGLPTVITEALAIGTPVVATDVTGIPEIVRHEETGVIVPQNAPEALAAACRRIFDHPDEADRYARAGRNLVEADFDIHRNAAAIREILLPGAASAARPPQQFAGV